MSWSTDVEKPCNPFFANEMLQFSGRYRGKKIEERRRKR